MAQCRYAQELTPHFPAELVGVIHGYALEYSNREIDLMLHGENGQIWFNRANILNFWYCGIDKKFALLMHNGVDGGFVDVDCDVNNVIHSLEAISADDILKLVGDPTSVSMAEITSGLEKFRSISSVIRNEIFPEWHCQSDRLFGHCELPHRHPGM